MDEYCERYMCKEKITVQKKIENIIYFENLKAYLIFEHFE